MMKIEKKVWPYYFKLILEGRKNYELRLANFHCREGDILLLREWDPDNGTYTGRQIEKEITYVTTLKDIPFWSPSDIEEHGFQIISFRSD